MLVGWLSLLELSLGLVELKGLSLRRLLEHLRVLQHTQLGDHLSSEHRVRHDSLVVVGDELLDHRQRLCLELLGHLGVYLCDIGQVIDPHVLIADVLKNLTRDLAKLEALRMDKVTEVSPGAASGPVVVPARDCAIVGRVYDLVRVGRWDESLLGLLQLVCLLEFVDRFLGQSNELVVFHVRVLCQKLSDSRSLI